MIKHDSEINYPTHQVVYGETTRQQKIANQFSRAATSYDAFAIIQKLAANKLITLLPATLATNSMIVDMGCGTGFQTKRLSQYYTTCKILGIDFALGMLKYATKDMQKNSNDDNNLLWCAGNIELLPLHKKCCDLLFSNLTFQWCHCIKSAMSEAARILLKAGRLIFSVLVSGSLGELASAWKSVDNNIHVNNQACCDVYIDSLKSCDFKVNCMSTGKHVIYYSNFFSIIESLKKTGSNTLVNSRSLGLLSLNKFKKLQLAYEDYRQRKGLPVTYNILYIDAIKK